MSDLEYRVMELEIKNAHQEDTIEQLNHLVFQQQQSIDKLFRHLEQVQNKIDNMQENNTGEELEPPPPHY